MIPAKEIDGELWIKASDLNRVVNREWVGLTDDEANDLLEHTDWYEWPHLLIKNVQDALKRKNNVF